MSRITVAWIAISLMAVAAGCRMCASPYDYCSPTFTGGCGEDCAPFVRAGSILSSPDACPLVPLVPAEHVAEEAQTAPLPVDDEGASPILASTSDDNSKAPPQTGPTLVVEEGPSLAIEIEQPSSDGWRAATRRSETSRY